MLFIIQQKKSVAKQGPSFQILSACSEHCIFFEEGPSPEKSHYATIITTCMIIKSIFSKHGQVKPYQRHFSKSPNSKKLQLQVKSTVKAQVFDLQLSE